MINIIKGSDKYIVIRLTSGGESKDPFDLTQASMISACFKKTDLSSLELYYLSLTGTTVSASDVVTLSSTSNISEGDPIYGPGLTTGATVIKTPTSLVSPSATGTVQISVPATASGVGVAIQIGEIYLYQPAVLGKIRVHLSEEDSDLLEAGEEKNFEVKIVIDGFTSYLQFEASLNIINRYC